MLQRLTEIMERRGWNRDKISNKPLTAEQSRASSQCRERLDAQCKARLMLERIYELAWRSAEKHIPQEQKRDNWRIIADMTGHKNFGKAKDGYIMVVTPLDLEPKPVLLKLDYEVKATGGLTLRSLHQQLRHAMQLEKKVALRIRCLRPWHRHMTEHMPVPEKFALPCNDAQCADLLGTTLLCYKYVDLA